MPQTDPQSTTPGRATRQSGLAVPDRSCLGMAVPWTAWTEQPPCRVRAPDGTVGIETVNYSAVPHPDVPPMKWQAAPGPSWIWESGIGGAGGSGDQPGFGLADESCCCFSTIGEKNRRSIVRRIMIHWLSSGEKNETSTST